MSHYTYHPHRSQIVDVFYVPLFAIESSEWDMTQKERDALKDIWPIKEELKKQLAPLTEDIKRLCLWGEAYSLAHILYFYLIYQKGQEPKTVAETLALFETLTAEEISTCYGYQIHRNYVEEKVEDLGLLAYLDKIDLPADEKWHWFQAIQKPVETVQALVTLLAQVDQLYQPYYDRFEAERQAYLANFDLDDFFNHMPTMGVKDLAAQHGKDYELLVLSPVHIRVAAMLFAEELDMDILLITSTRMEGLISRNDEMDMDDFSTLLKTMSDETRYRVLQELTQGAKNKAIAEKLGITGAAVSFHTQKLLNAKLILVDSDDKAYKYKANQGLIQQMIDKFTSDFNLKKQASEQKTVTKEKEDMPVVIKDGIWYDQAGRPLTDEEKAQVKDQVYAELDKDLKDTGFEGLIKKFIKYLMAKNGKGLGKYLHMDNQKTLVGWQPEVNSSAAKQQPLPTDSSELAEELIDVEEDLADVAEELTDVNYEIEDLTTELESLSANLARLQTEEERLKARRQAILERYGELSR